MRLKGSLSLLFLWFLTFQAESQWLESFNDGNFSSNPQWLGDTASWSLNGMGQLQSQNNIANNIFYISTLNNAEIASEWEFYVSIAFNPSSANYIDVFLKSSDSALLAGATKGYFVRLGNSEDEISLYRKDSGSTVEIIDGPDGLLNNANNSVKVNVSRDFSGTWRLRVTLISGGNRNFSYGDVRDTLYQTGSYFGILIKQSTASFFNKHFIDDISIRAYVPDTLPPSIIDIRVVDSRHLYLILNEPLRDSSCGRAQYFQLRNGSATPILSYLDSLNTSGIHLFFNSDLPVRTPLLLLYSGIQDLLGNSNLNDSFLFYHYIPQPFDITIDEIMADPIPAVGWPEQEWIEIKNTSPFPINIADWRLKKSNYSCSPFPSYILKPDSFLVLLSVGVQNLFSLCPSLLPVTGFPSLINESDVITLIAKDGTCIHSVQYSENWHSNPVKKSGGWSLEMMDTDNPCSGFSNWKSSVDVSGATPGRINSVKANNPDNTAPDITGVFLADTITLNITLSESIDSIMASDVRNYLIDDIYHPFLARAISPFYNSIILKIVNIHDSLIHRIHISGLRDCGGNVMNERSLPFGRALTADSFDVVVNEILFNPITGGSDYIELFNKSGKIINIKNLLIANKDETDVINDMVPLSESDRAMKPDEYLVFTTDRNSVLRDYRPIYPDNIIELSSMPSFPNDKGKVVLLNETGSILDEVPYEEDWHLGLINNPEGVALERIRCTGLSSDPANWQSAASNIGYGTPTFKNSQSRNDDITETIMDITPEIFSPDNDGHDDFISIKYAFKEPGYMLSISIFDLSGRLVRVLQNNAVAGTLGYFKWDGLGGNGKAVTEGTYIILMEYFSAAGKRGRQKKRVILIKDKN